MFDLENFPTRELARDMMGMISPIYDNSYVGKWIFEVMSVPLSLAQDTINELREQAFPETATWSLPYWEQSYGLPTNEASGGAVGDIEFTDKLLNGFKVAYTGSAKSVTMDLYVRGGM